MTGNTIVSDIKKKRGKIKTAVTSIEKYDEAVFGGTGSRVN